MITKTLIIVNGMTGQEMPVMVESGATPANILSKVGLPNYQLARVKNRQVLRSDCDVTRVTGNHERLFAFSPMIVGDNR